jgi:hypothetical protein
MKIKLVSCLFIIAFSALMVACSNGQSHSSSDNTEPATGQTTIIHTTATSGEIDVDQAIAIAKSRFEEYLLKRPEMKVKDPIYSAKKKEYNDNTEYWSVTVKLKEPEYKYYYYEVHISLDGVKVTLATG